MSDSGEILHRSSAEAGLARGDMAVQKKIDFPFAVVANAGSIMALSIMRSLGRQGVPISAVFGKNSHSSLASHSVRFSKFITEKHGFDESDYEGNLVSALMETGFPLKTKAVLFPVTDQDMIVVSANRAALRKYYHILMPPHDLIEILLHKERFYEFAYRNDLPVPQTFLPSEADDIQDISSRISYPCIIKPTWRTKKWIAIHGNQKVLIADDPEKLCRIFDELFPRFNHLTVQEIITGEEENILCSFTYLDVNSIPLNMFVCRKIRQYPPYYGDTSVAESIFSREIVELTENICKKLGLSGYVSIEFKKDSRNDSYKIMEITVGRINRQAGLADSLGINIPYTWYAYQLGLPTDKTPDYVAHQKWVSEFNEVRAFPRYFRNGYNILKWFRSYRNIKRFELLAKDDLKPALMALPSLVMSRD
ncbi:MAG: hypothetical protein ABR523_08850 [Desulfurivibrionaceae bacterium]